MVGAALETAEEEAEALHAAAQEEDEEVPAVERPLEAKRRLLSLIATPVSSLLAERKIFLSPRT